MFNIDNQVPPPMKTKIEQARDLIKLRSMFISNFQRFTPGQLLQIRDTLIGSTEGVMANPNMIYIFIDYVSPVIPYEAEPRLLFNPFSATLFDCNVGYLNQGQYEESLAPSKIYKEYIQGAS